jgi:hypothetical protein
MAYLKPPWFTVRVFNRIAMATGISNSETPVLGVHSRRVAVGEKRPGDSGRHSD